ncbi:MAG TPA: NIPSNAP family protein [Actinomycetota bacterium]|nr:NIPSNAP family protein [Actinomycetota bacterium]
MTTSQLRTYRITEGELDQFTQEWREHVAPLREAHGFRVDGAWTDPDTSGFVWVISHDGDFAAADAGYFASDERTSLDPDPARLIEATETRMMRPVQ